MPQVVVLLHSVELLKFGYVRFVGSFSKKKLLYSGGYNLINKVYTSAELIDQLFQSALVAPATIMKPTTPRLSAVKILFILEDSLTPSASTHVISSVIPAAKKS